MTTLKIDLDPDFPKPDETCSVLVTVTGAPKGATVPVTLSQSASGPRCHALPLTANAEINDKQMGMAPFSIAFATKGKTTLIAGAPGCTAERAEVHVVGPIERELRGLVAFAAESKSIHAQHIGHRLAALLAELEKGEKDT